MKAFFTLVFLVTAFITSAQNTFRTRVFLPGSDYLKKVIQLDDGSFVSLTFNYSSVSRIRLVKTDAAGAVVAFKEITAASPYNVGSAIIKTADGGFAVAGGLNNSTVLLKFKADMSLAWQREYDESFGGSSDASGLIQTEDGGYMLAGSASGSNFKYAGTLTKTDSLGAIQYQKRYFDYSGSTLFGVTPLKGGGYAFFAFIPNGSVYNICKINEDGTLAWAREIDDNNGYPVNIQRLTGTSDGNLLAAGYDAGKIIIVKIDSSGNLTWLKTMQNPNTGGDAGAILEDKDGEYLFAGTGYQLSTGINYGYAAKLDTSGVLQWTKTFEPGFLTSIAFSDCIATPDGGYAACGPGTLQDSDGNYRNYGFVYKFNSSFEVCGDTTGSTADSLANFGTLRTVQLSATDISSNVINPNVLVSDAAAITETVCSDGALSVQLLSFTAALQGKSVSVNWTTVNEVNADYFVVERSADKRSFMDLQRVSAKGNSSIMQSYSINDLQPLPGTSYYRLKEVDKDGKVMYSSIAAVTVMSNGTIVISPNPVQNMIHVVMQSMANNMVVLQVVDMRGNIVAAQTKAVSIGRNEINIPASSLARSVYVLKVTDSKTSQAVRFVKE